jgi:hypothetical protein
VERTIIVINLDDEKKIAQDICSSLKHNGVKCIIFDEPFEKEALDSLIDSMREISENPLLLVIFSVMYESSAIINNLIYALKNKNIQFFLCPTKSLEYPPSASIAWENFLIFNNKQNYQTSVSELIEISKPEVNRRKELLSRLKRPSVIDKYTYQELAQYALLGNDQSLQCSAISGLEFIGGADAVNILTKRILDVWGTKSIDRAIIALAHLHNEGGFLGLSSTILFDDRYFFIKLRAIYNQLLQIKDFDSSSLIEPCVRGNYSSGSFDMGIAKWL